MSLRHVLYGAGSMALVLMAPKVAAILFGIILLAALSYTVLP